LQNLQDVFFLQTNGSGVLSFAGVSPSAGQVIQVVQATTTTNTTHTNSSYQTMNLSASITPSSTSNKVLVFACGGVFTATSGSLTFYRNSTNILSSAGFIRLGNNISSTFSAQYLDSPSTTSSTTYAVYGKTGQQIQAPCQDQFDGAGITAMIILMEVKG
jgi:hypothetical protein